ncbi:MAG: ArnT family glycosyltransferase [Solirubrobacteraceae bacterium]
MNRIVVSTAAGLSAVLVALAGGYGYHRDELYFVAAGRHLDWAYADQGPFTPLVARAMSEIAPDSLTVLRIPSALAAGATVLLTGLLARELGGGPRAQVIAAACTAVAGLVLFTGHILSTSTFDLLAWTAVTWLAVRAVRGGRRPALARRRRRALLSERDTGPVIALSPDLGRRSAGPRSRARLRGSTRTAPGRRSSSQLRRGGRYRPLRPALGLPHAHSGHDAYGDWGPPPDGSAPVVAVGIRPRDLVHLRSCRVAAPIDNGVGVDNDEQGAGAGLPRTGPADPGQPGGDRPPRARRRRGRARADDAGGPGAAGPAIL